MMLIDLCKAIEEWTEDGDQVIVMMDANEDVSGDHITAKWRKLGSERQ